ncbi:SURF1 family cytochrome oxidase biogenesis protein [Streptomyces sp. NBC_01803]|uniref:SURF1 family cytochrome oxidase biogenesis protein n=1 Tax=Streptomyces sp. NBC_01803 TaxID=2975946 RepID=UPI002DDA8CD0|nr:SURF1 family protein [Streptomyces sp. NBC_01803]WSA46843.1 SURF1 family protein [Streptomyces sp. NBC_01803]
MYRFLLSRQWVLLTLVALAMIPCLIWLGFWQLHRHEQRVERNDLIGDSLAADPVPMSELTAPGGAPDPDDRYRPVTATGVYDTDDQVVVRNRTGSNGAVGYYVLTPLVEADGTGVLVNRGFVPAGSDYTRVPDVAEPPTGEVTVTGRLMADESTGTTGIRDRDGLPDGMIMMINSQERGEAAGLPMLGGYLELTETSPAPRDAEEQPEPLPEPDHTGIGSHFAYAIQWWMFAGGVPVGWFLLLRREVQDLKAARGKKAASTPTEPVEVASV